MPWVSSFNNFWAWCQTPRCSCLTSVIVVRGAGLEPAQYCYRQDLNLVRLPISPPALMLLGQRRILTRANTLSGW